MRYDDFTVILPTLNEGETIGILIRQLLADYRGISIVVADDGSVDGTSRIVRGISHGNSKVSFFDRHGEGLERGLTASAVDAIRKSKTRYCIVMDADMQHPAEVVGKIAFELSRGSSLVVAIRADVKKWELYRKVISKALIWIGYAILVATAKSRCDDIFSGFFGVERRLFVSTYEKNRERFVGGGYKILFDFMKCIGNGGIKIGQVPYSFGVRRHGASKAGFRQGLLLFRSFFS